MDSGADQPAFIAVSDRPPGSLHDLARHIAVVGIAGVVSGLLVGGVGGRLFMRIAGAAAPESAQGALTDAGFRVGEVTVGGTVSLVLFVGILIGMAGAVLYAVFRPWLHWAGRFRGVVFGLVLFAVGSATSSLLDPENIDFAILGNGVLLVVMIVGLFLGFGVVIDRFYGVLDRRLPTGENRRWVRLLYAESAVVGLIAAVFLVFPGMLFDNRDTFCSNCDAPLTASIFVVVATVGSLVWWASGVLTRFDRLRGAARAFGYVGLGGATLFGLIRAISDAVEVIG